tara:strand:+ start:2657 stop:2815 length:159 start_codon:yes stop_codon:yes gene_type:complete
MSCLQNEMILENLFDEVLGELEAKNFHLLFTQEDMEEVASKIAQSRFDDLCQ